MGICNSQALADQRINSGIRLLVLRTRAINVLTVITAKGHNRMKYFTIDNENDIRVHASAAEADAVANAERFGTSAGLTKLAEKWTAARLVEIWNSLPGSTPVKKFTDRATAASRIWKSIQNLGEPRAKTEPVPSELPATVLTPEAVEAAIPTAFQSEAEVAPEALSESEPPIASVEPEPERPIEPVATEQPVLDTAAEETVAAVSAQAPDVAPETPARAKKTSRAKKTPTDAPTAKGPRENSKTDTILRLLKRPGGASLKDIMEAISWQAHSVRGFVSATLTKKMGLSVVSAKSESGERTYSINA
jgi:hypothetical protein